MDILNHNRIHNLKEDIYNEIKSLIVESFDDDNESDWVKLFKKDKQLKVVLMSRNDEKSDLFENYHELFDRIGNLID